MAIKLEKRSCPFCQRALEIPSDAQKFTCVYCGKNLVKINKPSIRQMFITKDEIDVEITKKTMFNFAMQLNTDGLIFKMGTEEKNTFTGHMLELTGSLLKANSHLRKYIEAEQKEIDELIAKNENQERTIIDGSNPIELNTEFDGFLVHIKAALDSLAKTTNPLFGFNLEKWGRSTDSEGNEKSGIKILNTLKRKFGENQKKEEKLLIKFIEDNLDWLTFVVGLRNKPVHHGKSSSSDLIFNYHTKTVTPQMLHYSGGKSETVKNFMKRTIGEILEFVHNFLFLSFTCKLPADIRIGIDEKGNSCWLVDIPKELR